MKKIKNKEIAEILGISTTAVSLAINNKPGVSEETREKVLAILAENVREQQVFNNENLGNLLLIIHKKTRTNNH